MGITSLLAGKGLIIGAIALTTVSATGASYATKVYWENKYQKLELVTAKEKAESIASLQASINAAYKTQVSDYNTNIQKLAEIEASKVAEVEQVNRKYRNIYASYSKLQRKSPTPQGCDIPADRSSLLVLAGEQANQARLRLAPAPAGPPPPDPRFAPAVPPALPGRVRGDKPG